MKQTVHRICASSLLVLVSVLLMSCATAPPRPDENADQDLIRAAQEKAKRED